MIVKNHGNSGGDLKEENRMRRRQAVRWRDAQTEQDAGSEIIRMRNDGTGCLHPPDGALYF